ncbi:MAG TPA: TIM-barrel domain-containing protein [Rectinemataceae bacterium]|nr:TIM-barrel domain-containing protein [Rectinemataceae bacterium]
MIHAISNLQRLDIERKKAVLSGEKGRLELAVYGPGLVSVFYVMETQVLSAKAKALHLQLFSERFADPSSLRLEWESLHEDDSEFELKYGPLRLCVDKRTATVSAYRDGRLVHGGRIGDSNTVLPSYPLRIQQDSQGRARSGKFNFRLEDDDAFFGLGEKSGLLNKRNRSFKLFNRDALGYDAAISDPLYKSVPFFLKLNRESGALCGLYFPNLRVDEVNFGVESRFYYNLSMEGGPFGYFLMTGESYREILRSHAELVGRPALPPLFTFGYLGSSMAYTDPDDAQERTLAYFDRIEREEIPCEGMYFSSGYAKADNGERYTFVWNRNKFPDPLAFLAALRDRGYRICCNVKPGILTTHPWYAELARRRVFIPDASGEAFIGYYWGNSASFVDFSSEDGLRWWTEALTEHIIERGATGVWNDNNEFELEDESLPAQEYRSILSVLMAKASYDALRAARPGVRPWVISRAGYAGLQRYARTWTGDNVSDMRSLRHNIAMGLNLGLSGMPMYGHDIGGFFGPTPDRELLVRWCQSAVFQPRFVMHSWKTDGRPTEPWTYPEAHGILVSLIRERYRFLPYLYNLAIQASLSGLPIERALALEFPADLELDFDSLEHLSGEAILVPAPPALGESSVSLRLPAGADWYDPESGRLMQGGRSLTIEYPLDRLRYLIRSGTVVPTDPRPSRTRSGGYPELLFLVTPPTGGAMPGNEYYEDDGESDFEPGSHLSYAFAFARVGQERWRLEAIRRSPAGSGPRCVRTWRFTLPEGFGVLEGERQLGRELEMRFEEPPERFQVEFRGTYPPG